MLTGINFTQPARYGLTIKSSWRILKVRTTCKEMKKIKPKYRQLADKIKAAILAGEFLPGELIPSENALRETYQLSRYTVRQAIDTLVGEGYLRKEQGSGTYVSQASAAPG